MPCPDIFQSTWTACPQVSVFLYETALKTDKQTSYHRLSTKLVRTFADRRCRVVSATDPYGRILDFLDRNRYHFLLSKLIFIHYKPMLVSVPNNVAEIRSIKIFIKFFENVTKLKYLETAVAGQKLRSRRN
jgi:hypothetical protein